MTLKDKENVDNSQVMKVDHPVTVMILMKLFAEGY